MRFLRLLQSGSVGLLVALTPPAAAQPQAVSEDFVLGAWSDPATCNINNAQSKTVSDVHRQGAALNGQCVSIDGFWMTRAIFGRASDAKKKRSNVTATLNRKRVGIYAKEDVLDRAPSKPSYVRLVGIIDQCETAWPGAMMVMGYCHYTGGPIIKVSQVLHADSE